MQFKDLTKEEKDIVSAKAQTPIEAIESFNPMGYWILVREIEPESKTKGGIILSDRTKDDILMSSTVGVVINMGTGAYKGKAQFDDGAWCKIS